MREAAVGFQCGSCVAAGAKSTRQARGPYGGTRSTNPALTSIALVIANVGVFLALLTTGRSGGWLFDKLVLIPLGRCEIDAQAGYIYPGLGEQACQVTGGTSWVDGVASGSYWQLLTSAFSHIEIWHIGFNMLALWILGPQLEVVLGRARFLALYFGSALAGSAAVLWLAEPYGATLGASGAVFGLMGALLVVAHKVGGQYQQVLVWIGINVAITVVGRGFISWQGHLGGLVAGVLIAAVVVYAPAGARRTLWQAVGLGLIALVILALTATRILTL